MTHSFGLIVWIKYGFQIYNIVFFPCAERVSDISIVPFRLFFFLIFDFPNFDGFVITSRNNVVIEGSPQQGIYRMFVSI